MGSVVTHRPAWATGTKPPTRLIHHAWKQIAGRLHGRPVAFCATPLTPRRPSAYTLPMFYTINPHLSVCLVSEGKDREIYVDYEAASGPTTITLMVDEARELATALLKLADTPPRLFAVMVRHPDGHDQCSGGVGSTREEAALHVAWRMNANLARRPDMTPVEDPKTGRTVWRDVAGRVYDPE